MDLACLDKLTSNTPTSPKPQVREENMLGLLLYVVILIFHTLGEVEPTILLSSTNFLCVETFNVPKDGC